MSSSRNRFLSQEHLSQAIEAESQKFQEWYLWLEQAMPDVFFADLKPENILLITHTLIGFHLQNYFASINLKRWVIALCLDSPDADIRILKNYTQYGIKSYRTYVSETPPPFLESNQKLRIAVIYFTEVVETVETSFSSEAKERLHMQLKQRNPQLNEEEFKKLIASMNQRFLTSLPAERLVTAVELYFKAQREDACQYFIYYDENSMHILLAWADISKNTFLYRVATAVYKHGLLLKGMNATFINPYSKDSVLIMALHLQGAQGQDVRKLPQIPDFLRELFTIKYFPGSDLIEQRLVTPDIVSGVMGNLLRAMVTFIHQTLVLIDPNLYSLTHIEKDLCRHPELTQKICDLFASKFSPEIANLKLFETQREALLNEIQNLDTGQDEYDWRCKTVLKQAVNMISHTLKTNFYRLNETGLSFRLDPAYLDFVPFKRTEKFPELPYAIFFTKSLDSFGFHIRFKDLARGGLRTVLPEPTERLFLERNAIFTECYNLAWTQQKKNKDIPEGGAKAIIFIQPYQRLDAEIEIIRKELEASHIDPKEISNRLKQIYKELKLEYFFQAQRAFVEALIVLCNCDTDGKLRANHIIDYWNKPEYLYLGPDENMFPEMIEWIADCSIKHRYKPGGSFITSGSKVGFNHKKYGVTSLGVTVCIEETLKAVGTDPHDVPFTVKMTGGPDGDVAGNQILNLYKQFPNTAKLIALTDVSGMLYEPKGVDFSILAQFFYEGKPVKYYPPQKLSEGGFLIDKEIKRNPTPHVQQTLCQKVINGKLVEEWLSGNEVNHLLRQGIHKTEAEVFTPGGGRPRSLNDTNVQEFLNGNGMPTSKIIVEGANLYLTPGARIFLEKLGVLIIKDSSANKGGVICSSFEVLCALALGSEGFLAHKEQLIKEVLERIRECTLQEVRLLLNTYQKTGEYLTVLSDRISEKINLYTYEILDYLDTQTLSSDPKDPLIACFLGYCLPTLRKKFQAALLKEIPDPHKKAIIACRIAAHLVYTNGLEWSPKLIEILPSILASMPQEE